MINAPFWTWDIPSIRRLIEEVKQSAFRESAAYGRTSYIVTPRQKIGTPPQMAQFDKKSL